MLRVKRFVAAASLLIIGITEGAPHRHGDALFEAPATTEVHSIRCSTPSAGVPHLHRDRARQIDPCLACFRQHMQATASKVILGTPAILQQFLTVTARVAHAEAIRLRKSSRAPPMLVS
jgi:hypothetical protein